MKNILSIKQKIYFIPIITSIILISFIFLVTALIDELNQNYSKSNHTNEFAKQNLTLSKDVLKLNTLVQQFTYLSNEKNAQEVKRLYTKIFRGVQESNVAKNSNVKDNFDVINTHLEKYKDNFDTLEKQILLYKITHLKKDDLINNTILSIEDTLPKQYPSYVLYVYKIENLLSKYYRDLDANTLKKVKSELKFFEKSILKLEIKSLDKIVKKYKQLVKKEIQIFRANLFLVNVVLAAESYEVLYQATLISKISSDTLDSLDNEVKVSINSMNKQLSFMTIASLIILLFVSVFIARSIVKPISLLTTAFHALSKGKKEIKIPEYSVNDDIGELTNAAKLFKQQTEKIDKLLKESESFGESLQEAKKLAEGANKSKSSFLANMSHEIRTPLNAIMGFIELLKKDETDEKKIEYINIVQNSSSSLLGVINDILDISKVEDGKLRIERIDFNLIEQIGYLVEFYRSTTKEKNITLNLIYEEDVPLAINSDPLRLKQILSNLISNAIKYSPDNSSIDIKMTYSDEMLFIHVTDEGIGISEEAIGRVFSAFEQAEVSTTRKFGGTGLGLSIAKRLVELLGGEIKVESTLDVGSDFNFYIKAKKVDKIIENDNVELLTFFNAHLLIAEDNKTNQLLITILLDDLGITYRVVNDGIEATKAVEKEDFDAILMDINMPNMNGMDATKIIKSKGYTLPIIALTANAMSEDIAEYLKIGMSGHISKPIDTKKLLEILSRFLESATN